MRCGPEFEEIDDGTTLGRCERSFFQSNWTCIWGRGCQGILDEPAPELGEGCCSVGAELTDVNEALNIDAFAAILQPERFQYHEAALVGGVFADGARTNTRVVDGACIFLNRPGFPGGAGCALHLAALDWDESPTDWKPSVCWQLPIRVDWELIDHNREVATVRRWSRADWGAEGETMAWCCTEGTDAYVGEHTVVESLGEELAALTSKEIYVELRRRLSGQ